MSFQKNAQLSSPDSPCEFCGAPSVIIVGGVARCSRHELKDESAKIASFDPEPRFIAPTTTIQQALLDLDISVHAAR